MARTLYRLTDKIVRNLAAPGYHADGGGLYLQISKAGTKSWVYRFRLKERTRDMGLGALRVVNLAEARAKTAECRALLTKGIDPIEAGRIQHEPELTSSEEAKSTGPGHVHRNGKTDCARPTSNWFPSYPQGPSTLSGDQRKLHAISAA